MNNFLIGVLTGVFGLIAISFFVGAYKGMWLMKKSNKFYTDVLIKRQNNRVKKRDKLIKNESKRKH